VNDINQLFTHLARCRAPREEMFGPIDFRGFGQDGSAALSDEEVNGCAQGWIGRNSGVTV
jgi:hypothetical protein